MRPELLDWLVEVDRYLYDREDVTDGENGQPMPNKAMRLRQQLGEIVPAFKLGDGALR